MVAMYNSADEGPKVVDAFSDNLAEFSTSSICAAFRGEFGNYISDILGLYNALRANKTQLEVYPDRNNDYKPVLPDVGDVDTADVLSLRRLLRTYFNQLWIWHGGRGAAPYTAIAMDCLQGKWSYLDQRCLPASVSRLQDPTAMVSLEVREWYKKIQGGSKPVFYFSKVTKADGSVLCYYTGPCARRHPKSRLEWSASSIVLASQVEEHRLKAGLRSETWADLPVARTFGTFVPFTDKQRKMLRDYSSEKHDLHRLAELCAEQENLGVAHRTDCVDPAPNAHAPLDLWSARLEDLFDRIWPNSLLFNVQHDLHPQYAMVTLIHWIKTNVQMRHLQSGSWLGGPAGARWMVALLFHLVRALTHLDKKRSVPAEIARCFAAEAHEQHWRMLIATINWLRGDLELTCKRLRETYRDRAEAWNEQVKCVYLAAHSFSQGTVLCGAPLVCAETYAVPLDDAALHSCYQHVLQIGPALASGENQDSNPAEDTSENITLPNFNSSISVISKSDASESSDDFDALADQTMTALRDATTPPRTYKSTANPRAPKVMLQRHEFGDPPVPSGESVGFLPIGPGYSSAVAQANRQAGLSIYPSTSWLTRAFSPENTFSPLGDQPVNAEAGPSKLSGDEGDVSDASTHSPVRAVTQRKRTNKRGAVSQAPPLALGKADTPRSDDMQMGSVAAGPCYAIRLQLDLQILYQYVKVFSFFTPCRPKNVETITHATISTFVPAATTGDACINCTWDPSDLFEPARHYQQRWASAAMPPGSKRSTADRPKTFLREGEKRIKYRSLGFSGVRQRFTSRPAAVISHDPTPGSARPDFSFDPRVTPGPTAEAWVAPQEVVEPARSSEELELDLDPSDELDQVLLDHGTTQSGKVSVL
ncbi:hypothetical protein FRC08_010535 [Ceratobasidium sp. 394]|nr:hypothetical protein FRC08_010535 [Ceratobasidium sp. 394]